MKNRGVGKKRIVLIIIMAALSFLTATIAIGILYNTSLDQQRLRLVEAVESEARSIEAIISNNYKDDSRLEYTISLKEIVGRSKWLGSSGEFIIAELQGDKIVLSLQNRHGHIEIVLKEDISGPMGQGMDQLSRSVFGEERGSITGVDYRGEKVLAAYEKLSWPGKNVVIIAKIDMSEIRAPYVKALAISGFPAVLLILLGALIFRRISNLLSQNLEESEKRYALAMRGANDGLWDRNLETGEVYFSPRWKEMLGYDDEELPDLIGEWKKRVHPHDYERVSTEIESYLKGSLPYYVNEYRMLHKDGSYRWILARGASVKNKTGEAIRFAGSHTDITERKLIEERLKEHSQFLQVLIDTVPSPVFYKDTNGVYLGCNRAYEKFVGLSNEQIMGKTAYDIAPKDLADKYNEMDKVLLRESGVQVYESIMEDNGGNCHNVVLNKAIFHKMDGTSAGIVGIMIDITEQKILEDELKNNLEIIEDSYRTWKATFDAIADPIVIYDTEFRIIKANRAYQQTSGSLLTEMMGRPYYEIYPKQDGPLEISLRYLKREEREKEEEIFMPSEGRTYKVRVYPQYDEVAKEIQFVQIMEDITNMKETQEMLLQSAKLASIGEVAASVAHELNNPMTSVLGYTSIILEDMKDGDENYRELKVIERESLRVRGIVRNLLNFARKRSVIKEETDINEVLKESISLVVHMAKVSNVKVETNLSTDLSWIEVDANQLKQVFINIMNNALHAMEEWGGTLSITTEMSGEDHKIPFLARNCILIKFKDSGGGIPEDRYERIFEPFFSSKGEKGTGLGLSISYGIVQNHGGDILVSSEEGKGTEFTVLLPLEANSENQERLEETGLAKLEATA